MRVCMHVCCVCVCVCVLQADFALEFGNVIREENSKHLNEDDGHQLYWKIGLLLVRVSSTNGHAAFVPQ